MARSIVWTSIFTILLSLNTVRAAETFISFDVPGATVTGAQGINDDGAVAGFFVDSAGKQHGFMLSGGNFTTIDYPGALATDARGINKQGDIVGIHIDVMGQPGGGLHGYLLQQGAFTAMDYPGHLNTITQRITDGGVILGCYHDTDTMGTMHGIAIKDGNFTDLSMQASMNNGGTADGSVTAGLYIDMMTGASHAFIAANGTLAPFDFPFSIATSVWDMNSSGEVVGNYVDAAKKAHSFVLSMGDSVLTFGASPQGVMAGSFRFNSIDYPGAASTSARGINRHGDVVGSYVDAAGKTHGFFLSRGRRRSD